MGARAEYSRRRAVSTLTSIGRDWPVARSKRADDFFDFREGFSGRKNYCAAGWTASLAAGFSAAMVVTDGLKARTAGISFCSGAVWLGFSFTLGGSDEATGADDGAMTAWTAA